MKKVLWVLFTGIVATNCKTTKDNSSEVLNRPAPVEQPAPVGDAWFTLDGHSAKTVFDSMYGRAVDGVKSIDGDGDLFCTLRSGDIPPGAQGIAAPGASCVAYPNVDFPAGVQGIVAPWFQVNGFAGYDIYAAMDVIPEGNTKSYQGHLNVECKQSADQYSCTFKKTVVDTNDKIEIEGQTARAIQRQILRYNRQGRVEGQGAISCTAQASRIPDGAQGIAAPSASCTAYPHVDFPDGAQGIVTPWFTVRGYQGFELLNAMAGETDENNSKTLAGNLIIDCKRTGRNYKCTIEKTDDVEPQPEETVVADLENSHAAQKIFEQLDGGNTRTVEGEGSIACDLQVSNIPVGAQGIAAPAANCSAYPQVNFPAGAQGLVRAWFQLSGYAGYELYDALSVEEDRRGQKSVTGNIKISCSATGRQYSCKISKVN